MNHLTAAQILLHHLQEVTNTRATQEVSHLCNRLQASSKLELVDTMVDRLAVGGTLRNGAFAAPAAHTDLVYDIALLGLVAQPARLVGPGGAWGAVQHRELAVLPAARPQ